MKAKIYKALGIFFGLVPLAMIMALVWSVVGTKEFIVMCAVLASAVALFVTIVGALNLAAYFLAKYEKLKKTRSI